MKLQVNIDRDNIQTLSEIYGAAWGSDYSLRGPIKNFTSVILNNAEIRAAGDSYLFLNSLASILPIFIIFILLV
jgi:hypothetical protein